MTEKSSYSQTGEMPPVQKGAIKRLKEFMGQNLETSVHPNDSKAMAGIEWKLIREKFKPLFGSEVEWTKYDEDGSYERYRYIDADGMIKLSIRREMPTGCDLYDNRMILNAQIGHGREFYFINFMLSPTGEEILDCVCPDLYNSMTVFIKN